MAWNVKPEMVEHFKKTSTTRGLGIGPRDVDDMVRELSEKYRTCPQLRDAVDWGSSLNH